MLLLEVGLSVILLLEQPVSFVILWKEHQLTVVTLNTIHSTPM